MSEAKENRGLVAFAVVAFGLPLVSMLPLWLCHRAGSPTDVFAGAQMYYPAAGTALALLLTKKDDPNLPRGLFIGYAVCAMLAIVPCVGQLAAPQAADWDLISNFVYIITSLAVWVLLAVSGKGRRAAYGLQWKNGLKSLGLIALFVLLTTVKTAAAAAVAGQAGEMIAYFKTAVPWIILASLAPSFFLSFLPFWGEEYGWRYYLQPILQRRFGRRGGVLVLGLLWGLWHMPLNLFFYSPDTALQSVACQLIGCTALAIYFAYAIMKTGNIWTAVVLHYLNNNLIVVFTGSADISNQIIGWGDVLLSLVIYSVLFLPFLAAKEFRSSAFQEKQ